jgi:hypothetical protein
MSSFRRYPIPIFILVFLIFFSSNFAYAKKWNVYPAMARVAIQAVIDTAVDGDVIFFNPGTYDFSLAPPNYYFQNGGALQITEKSLTIKGAPGSTILGAPVEIDPDKGWMRGINCFWILNSDARKDVAFDGLTIQTFMNGIFAVNSSGEINSVVYYSNLRNLAIKNCTFLDIERSGIGVAEVQGDITIANNTINGGRTSSRFGIYFDWYRQPGNREWQPKNTLVTVKDNSIGNMRFGIYSLRVSNILIRGNVVSNAQIGIVIGGGLRNAAAISNNTFSNLSDGIEISGSTYPLGGVTFEEVAQGITLKSNVFSNISSTGISIWGDLAHTNSIVYNTINMGSGSAIYSEGYNNEYKNNVIQGYGDYAVNLSGVDNSAYSGLTWGAHNEYFKNNSVADFNPQDPSNPGNAGWHYQLDAYTHDNTVIGTLSENATYINNGTNNIFKFVYPYLPPPAITSLLSLNPLKTQNSLRKEVQRGRETL